jgi:hypothetical protein
MRNRFILPATIAVALIVTGLSTAGAAKPGNGIPEQLARIEAALTTLVGLVPPPPPEPTAYNRTRLLVPFVTNQAGFDTGITIANTGLDSSGVVGTAGACTVHYFGKLSNGNPPPALSETTNIQVAPGQTISFVLSSGGSGGLVGSPNFQGYIEIDCAFPFAHGFSFITDGPIGQARVASSAPALVLPRERTNTTVEAAGQ